MRVKKYRLSTHTRIFGCGFFEFIKSYFLTGRRNVSWFAALVRLIFFRVEIGKTKLEEKFRSQKNPLASRNLLMKKMTRLMIGNGFFPSFRGLHIYEIH